MKDLKLIALTDADFKSFPNKFSVVQEVFAYYFDMGFTGKRIGSIGKKTDSFNDAQKTLCLHFICDGLIGGSGLYAILLETRGEFNSGYSKALELIGDAAGKKIMDELASIYNTYEQWFSKLTYPPALNEGSKSFDKNLSKRIDLLEKKWYANDSRREKLFNAYLRKHKLDLVKRK